MADLIEGSPEWKIQHLKNREEELKHQITRLSFASNNAFDNGRYSVLLGEVYDEMWAIKQKIKEAEIEIEQRANDPVHKWLSD